jgi:ArsR family transcriptional regulator, arsenate/arsenite/antimonite-responsive transcriptional repressor
MTNRRHDAEADLDHLVETAKGLAHPARLRLLAMLGGGELCVCQMTAILELAPSTVSEHLSVLSRGGLVAERKAGRLVFYRLRDSGAGAALLPPLLSLLAADSTVKSDRAVVVRLRRVPVAALCAADLDLDAVGVRVGPTQRRPPAASVQR